MQASMQVVTQRSASTMRPAFPSIVNRPAPRDPLDLLEQFGTTVKVQREREIHDQGDIADSCYRVMSGCVRLVTLMEDGRRHVSAFLLPGDLFGFDALETHDFAAEAVSDVVLRRYPRRTVEALAEQQMPLARRLRDLTAANLRAAHGQLVLLGRKTASEKIGSFLIEMAQRLRTPRGSMLELPMSRTDMADHLGLTIETVCRILAHLRRDGTIAVVRGGVEIRDHVALQQIASEPRH